MQITTNSPNAYADNFLKLQDYDPLSGKMPRLTKEQFSYLASDLMAHHSIFYTLWELSTISFSRSPDLPTACVRFNPNKNFEALDFIFNPDFWEKLNHQTRVFVIMHECLHIIFKHGIRMKDTLNPKLVNIALDLIVNHTLVNRFNIDRSFILEWEKYCWVDTVFPGENIETDKYFEYYYGLLVKKCIDENKFQTVDMHGDGQYAPDGDKLLRQVDKLLSDAAKRQIKDLLKMPVPKSETLRATSTGSGGDEASTTVWTMPKETVNSNRKWKSLIKEFYHRSRNVWKDDDQWARIDRRFVLMGRDLIIPSSMEVNDDSKEKVKASFFIDASGSCTDLISRFWDAVKTVPGKYFITKLYSFDTCVRPIINEDIPGGGGTSFAIIEDYLQKEVAKGEKYPEIVVVISDLAGDVVTPQFPKRWHWIAPKGSTTQYIPKGSFLHDLETFER